MIMFSSPVDLIKCHRDYHCLQVANLKLFVQYVGRRAFPHEIFLLIATFVFAITRDELTIYTYNLIKSTTWPSATELYCYIDGVRGKHHLHICVKSDGSFSRFLIYTQRGECSFQVYVRKNVLRVKMTSKLRQRFYRSNKCRKKPRIVFLSNRLPPLFI